MKGEINLQNLNELIDWLKQRHIDTSLWGEDTAKSIAHLWGEISAGETILLEDPPRRVVQVVQVIIWRGREVLLEAEQVMENGSRRFRKRPPSEKLKSGESYLEAARRCLQEELGVAPEAVRLRPESYEVNSELQVSSSYPGLLTEYSLHRVEASVTGLPDVTFWRENETALAEAPVKRHRWEWRDGRSFGAV